MSISKLYKYIFYKIYRLAESMAAPWWSEWKASSIMDILLILLVLTICNYYNVYIDKMNDILSNSTQVVVLGLAIVYANYYIFNYKDKWKDIVEEFDKLPKKKNKIGSWLVLLVISLIIINLFFSFYLYSNVDWSLYPL